MSVIKCFNSQCHYHDRDEVDNCSHPHIQIQACGHAIVRHEDTRKCRDPYLAALLSNECQCSRTKNGHLSFCYKCYARLPRDLQVRLYRRMGEGYEEAYDEAVKFLEEV